VVRLKEVVDAALEKTTGVENVIVSRGSG